MLLAQFSHSSIVTLSYETGVMKLGFNLMKANLSVSYYDLPHAVSDGAKFRASDWRKPELTKKVQQECDFSLLYLLLYYI